MGGKLIPFLMGGHRQRKWGGGGEKRNRNHFIYAEEFVFFENRGTVLSLGLQGEEESKLEGVGTFCMALEGGEEISYMGGGLW